MTEKDRPTPPSGRASPFVFRLYVAGRSSNGTIALKNLTRFCELRLGGLYEIRVVDVLEEPDAAAADGVVATPTLVKDEPPPLVRLFGVLADEEELASSLGLERPASSGEAQPRVLR